MAASSALVRQATAGLVVSLIIFCAEFSSSFINADAQQQQQLPFYGRSSAQTTTSSLKFTIIGDWGEDNSKRDRVAHLLNQVNTLEDVEFTVSVGDNFYDTGVDNATDAQFINKWENIYDTSKPWYIIEGNHDWKGNPQAQIDYGKLHPNWILPNFYYDKIFHINSEVSFHLVFIDTEMLIKKGKEAAREEHLIWLESILKASTATWVFVVGHAPIYSIGEHGPNAKLIAAVDPLLKKYRVNGYISGHDHLAEYLEFDSIAYITSGDGGHLNAPEGVPNLGNPLNPPVLWYNAEDIGSIVLFEVCNSTMVSMSYLLADEKTPGYTVYLPNKRHGSR